MKTPVYLHSTYKKEISEKYLYKIEISNNFIRNFIEAKGTATFKFGYYSEHFGKISREEVKEQLSPKKIPFGLMGAIAIKKSGNIEKMGEDFLSDKNTHGLVGFSVPVDRIKERIKAYQTYVRKYPYTIKEPSQPLVLVSACLMDEEGFAEDECPSDNLADFLQRFRFLIIVSLQIPDPILKQLQEKNLAPVIKKLNVEWPHLDAVPYFDDKPLLKTDNPHYNPESSSIEWSGVPFWETKEEDNNKSKKKEDNNQSSEDKDENKSNDDSGSDINNNSDNDSGNEKDNTDVEDKAEVLAGDESQLKAGDEKDDTPADETQEAEPNRELELHVDIEHPSSIFKGLNAKGKLVIEVPDTLLSDSNWIFFNGLGKPEDPEIKLTSTIEVEFWVDLSAILKAKQCIHLWQMEFEGILPEINRFLVIEQILRDLGVRITKHAEAFKQNQSDDVYKGYRIEGMKYFENDKVHLFLEIYGLEESLASGALMLRQGRLEKEDLMKYIVASAKVQIDLYVSFYDDFQRINDLTNQIHILLKERLSRVVLR